MRVLALATACTGCFVRQSNSPEFSLKSSNFSVSVAGHLCNQCWISCSSWLQRGHMWSDLRGFCKRAVLCILQYRILPVESGILCFLSSIIWRSCTRYKHQLFLYALINSEVLFCWIDGYLNTYPICAQIAGYTRLLRVFRVRISRQNLPYHFLRHHWVLESSVLWLRFVLRDLVLNLSGLG